jgi:formate dehydrogenase subunit gamma
MSVPELNVERHQLARFTAAERWLHRTTAALMGSCLATAAVLYVGPLSTAIGRRELFAQIHVWSGILLPVPLILALVSRSVRADVSRLARFEPGDAEWLRSRTRRDGRIAVGKFNAGQKLNAAFTLGAILVMLGTGLVMRYANHWPISYRTGATYAHDWLAAAVTVVVLGHLRLALADPAARRGMRTGRVPVSWARREHAAWADEQTASPIGAPVDDRS